MRKRKPSQADLKFISENQKLSGFSGNISPETAAYEVDMDEIATSGERFGAQIPSPENRPQKPRITRWGPRKSPLDQVNEVIAATRFLRDSDGQLSAEKINQLYGIQLKELGEMELAFYEPVARLLTVLSEDEFRRWLRNPNPNLENEAPVEWIVRNFDRAMPLSISWHSEIFRVGPETNDGNSKCSPDQARAWTPTTAWSPTPWRDSGTRSFGTWRRLKKITKRSGSRSTTRYPGAAATDSGLGPGCPQTLERSPHQPP